MNKKISVLLVGMNGYGSVYVKELLNHSQIDLVGIVEINPTKSDYYIQINKIGIPIYETMEEFYISNKADLAIISTPIHFHKTQACYAMSCGSNVLCEKPITSNPDEIQEMIKVRDESGKFLAIGFDWSFTQPIQQLKKDIMEGVFGFPIRAKSLVLWPRDKGYFKRSSWAGKKYGSKGEMIFDSVANNATAHYLHNLLYLLGTSVENSAQLKEVTAKLYKTNKIETFDTCVVKMKTKSFVDIYYYASHAVKEKIEPCFELEFEKAKIFYEPEKEKRMIAMFKDGSKIVYESPDNDWFAKLNVCIKAIQQDRNDILCGPEAATPHVIAVNAMHESVPNIPSIPEELIKFDNETNSCWTYGLSNMLKYSYKNWCMPTEQINDIWGYVGEKINIS